LLSPVVDKLLKDKSTEQKKTEIFEDSSKTEEGKIDEEEN